MTSLIIDPTYIVGIIVQVLIGLEAGLNFGVPALNSIDGIIVYDKLVSTDLLSFILLLPFLFGNLAFTLFLQNMFAVHSNLLLLTLVWFIPEGTDMTDIFIAVLFSDLPTVLTILGLL